MPWAHQACLMHCWVTWDDDGDGDDDDSGHVDGDDNDQWLHIIG